jgi:hypothetical protein
MNLWRFLIVLGLALSPAVMAAGRDAWTHRQTLELTQPGLTRIELDPALLDASRATGGAPFHDLRVINPGGVEIPFFMAPPELLRPSQVEATEFKATLQPTATVLAFQARELGVINELHLQSAAPDFIKAATVEASLDGTVWQTLSRGEVLCRQAGSVRLRIPVTPAAWTHFRITIDDARSAPVVFTGAQIGRELSELPTVSQPVTIRSRREDGGRTRLLLDLGSAHVWLGSVRLHTPEPVFQRDVSLMGARRTLFRCQYDGFAGEEMELPVHQICTHQEVELVIDNGDSPPLRIDRIEASRHAVPIVFQADVPGTWRLYMGNAQDPAPRYDVAALGGALRQATAMAVVAGAVELNPDFRKTATAPEVGGTGAAIDVSAWPFQRRVQFKEAGVIELELDPEVLARAEGDRRDLRVVREGHHVPFLIIDTGIEREHEAAVVAVADPQRPGWSKWDVMMPFPGFPVRELRIDSTAPLFHRTLYVTGADDSRGGRFERVLGTADWKRTPGEAAYALSLRLHTPPAPAATAIQLATDNGDNAPLPISSVRVVVPVVRLLFRVPDTTPVSIFYGNRRATHVHYDLQMVQGAMEAATKVPATLGREEGALRRDLARRPAGIGSVWFWGVLALVVAVLLWVVARVTSTSGRT